MRTKLLLITGLFLLLGHTGIFAETQPDQTAPTKSNKSQLKYVQPTKIQSSEATASASPYAVAPIGLPEVTQAGFVLPSNMTATANVAPAASTSPEYILDIQDMLTIAVIQPDPFSVELTVAPDGTITFPYIGTVPVKGLTLMQAQEKIQTGLMDYMKYPVVSVSLRASKNLTFFVFGEVQRPGSYILEKDTTVLKAITTAGGFTRVAATNNVKVVRQSADGTTRAITVDVGALMTGKSTKDEKVEQGDVITVSQRFF